MIYADFLENKRRYIAPVGFDLNGDENPMLFPFQVEILRRALKAGRYAIFADCGLGKTPMQLDWSRIVAERTMGSVLIFTPLAVAQQTEQEAVKFGIDARVVSSADDVTGDHPVYITNYQKRHKFPMDLASMFSGVVLDESSILKSFGGSTRRELTQGCANVPYRLACTATPAPNDTLEIANHAEFLGVMTGKEMIALYFRQDGNTTHKWILKRHAADDFWAWLSQWAIAIRQPIDLGKGFDQDGFELPLLEFHEEVVEAESKPDGMLFDVGGGGIQERRAARRRSLEERITKAAEIVAAEPDEQWLLWCDLNDESEGLAAAIPGAVEVTGSDSPEHKEKSMLGFSSGAVRVLVTKPRIAGFGMNWQNCARMAFVGLSDSYEALYQATRRCWRFGQKRDVQAWIVRSTADDPVSANIKRKEVEARKLYDNLSSHITLRTQKEVPTLIEKKSGSDWDIWLGDSIRLIREVEPESVGLSIFSPPFPGMYAYTNSMSDVGNCKDIGELIDHFAFMVPDLLRITQPGRHCCIHLTQEPIFKKNEGHVGMRDFRGRVIQMMESNDWIYYGEVTIDKNPQIKASRTKEQTLLFKTLSTDSTNCRPALADYLLQFRKKGDNQNPVASGVSDKYNKGRGWITQEEWIEWAAPVWYRQIPEYPGGIRETDVLKVRDSKEDGDEKHLCPLQLGVIERAIKLWTNPGDLVFSPFAGIGSEGSVALRFDRRFLGIELKPSYFSIAAKNLEAMSDHGREQLRLA